MASGNGELKVGDIKPPKQLLEYEYLYSRDKSLYCLRPECDGCQFDARCQREETYIRIGPGINIRQALRAKPGFKWACIDYAGIELRVAAQYSGEPVWVSAFQNDLDLHAAVASIMFKVATPTKAQRDVGKMGNFGNLYLASIETFWHLTDLPYQEAAIAWKKWWAAVPVYAAWVERQKAFYKKNKYVQTFFGRRREMTRMIEMAMAQEGKKGKSKKSGWGFCDRSSVNMPVQGASADLLKIGMNRVHNWIMKEKLQEDIKMMLTVHDELDFEIRETPDMYEQLREIGRQMTLTPKGEVLPKIPGWKIPLKVDIEIGDDWGNLREIDEVDPTTKDRPKVKKEVKRDEVIIVVSNLTETDSHQLLSAIYRASSVDDVVKVPLRIQMGDRIYNSPNLSKVSEGHLRKLINGIPGIEIR